MGKWRVPVGVCPICSRERPLIQDHCYASGLCRGRICVGCNTRIGYFERDNSDLTRYVEHWRLAHQVDPLIRAAKPYDKRSARSLEAIARSNQQQRERMRKRRAGKRLLPRGTK